MSTQYNENTEIKRTSSGSIDYEYYDERARTLRSNTVLKMIRGMLTRKKKISCSAPALLKTTRV